MADVQIITGKRRNVPAPIKLDMTPLVDLAFLLLSFFILTTSLRRLEGITLAQRADGPGSAGKHVITVLVNGRDRLYGYAGAFDPDSTHVRRYGRDQLRVALRAVKDTTHFTCVIKTGEAATFQAVVDVLDDASFLGSAHYTVHEGFDPGESAAVERTSR